MTKEEISSLLDERIKPHIDAINDAFVEFEKDGLVSGYIIATGIRIDDEMQDDRLGLGGDAAVVWNALTDLALQVPELRGTLYRALVASNTTKPPTKCEA